MPIEVSSRVPFAQEREKQASGVVFASVGKRRNGGGVAYAWWSLAVVIIHPPFPLSLYPVPIEDDSCKRVEASDKAEITVLESCIKLVLAVYFLLFRFKGREGGRRSLVAPRSAVK